MQSSHTEVRGQLRQASITTVRVLWRSDTQLRNCSTSRLADCVIGSSSDYGPVNGTTSGLRSPDGAPRNPGQPLPHFAALSRTRMFPGSTGQRLAQVGNIRLALRDTESPHASAPLAWRSVPYSANGTRASGAN